MHRANRGCVGGKYEPLRIAGDVFQADDVVANQQVEITQPNVLTGFGCNGVNDGFLSEGGSIGIRRFHDLLTDFVADIDGRSARTGRYQSSFSVSQAHSFQVSLRRKDTPSYRRFCESASSPERGMMGQEVAEGLPGLRYSLLLSIWNPKQVIGTPGELVLSGCSSQQGEAGRLGGG